MLYREIKQQLSTVMDAGEAQAMAFMLLESICGMSRTEALMAPSLDPRPSALDSAIQRLLHGEPIQYVLGEAWFCGNRFTVAPGVLIPRPETEELVDWATEILQTLDPRHSTLDPHPSPLRILDIGTGSGCIAISLALRFPEAEVTAWDISPEALAIARQNAQHLGATNIKFEQVDILSLPLGGVGEGQFIISNPPYIPLSQAADMEAHVLDHEPHTALFVPDNDPLLFYRAIVKLASSTTDPRLSTLDPRPSTLYPRPSHPHILFETSHTHAHDVAALCRTRYANVELRHDQFGNPRMVHCSELLT